MWDNQLYFLLKTPDKRFYDLIFHPSIYLYCLSQTFGVVIFSPKLELSSESFTESEEEEEQALRHPETNTDLPYEYWQVQYSTGQVSQGIRSSLCTTVFPSSHGFHPKTVN